MKFIYPSALAVVLLILGVTAYTHWHTGSYVPVVATTATPSSTMSTASAYNMAVVSTHNSATSCWTAIGGNVYDLTSWISQHPGGSASILSLCGHDGTAAFEAQHGGQRRPEQELASFVIGTLSR